MEITYLGHSSFAICSAAGAVVVTDPYDSSIGFAMPRIRADAVTLSHRHYDHGNVAAVGGKPVVIDGVGDFHAGDISIFGTASFHDNFGGARRGQNVIYKFCADGVTICHLGDLGEDFSEARSKSVGKVNVLMIPVGGTYTIDGATAAKYVESIKPDVVIPMHYKVEKLTLDISTVDGFLKCSSGAEIVRGVNKLRLSPEDMSGSTRKIIIMER